MKTIKHYFLSGPKSQILELPKEAQILTVTERSGQLSLWAMFESDERLTERRTIHMFESEDRIHVIPGTYISSFQWELGRLTFHAFDASGRPSGYVVPPEARR